MKRRQVFVIIIGLALLALAGLGRAYKQRDFDYLFWNGRYYVITNQPVADGEIADEIGKVARQTPIPLFGKNNHGDSNLLPVGAPILTLQKSSASQELAVQKQGAYVKASVVIQ